MADNVSVRLRGDRELIRAFRELPRGGVAIFKKAAKKAAQPVLDSARAKAPRDTGALAAGLRIRVLTSRRRDVVGARVVTPTRARLGIPDGGGYYPTAQEFGWRDARTGEHRAGRPYLRPAAEENRASVQRSMSRVGAMEIEREWRRLARRVKR